MDGGRDRGWGQRGRRVPPDFGRGWGGGWGGSWGGGGGRRRARRGDIRRAVLTALKDGPANGYQIMQRLEERSGGLWRPSPGSIYPTLQLLEEGGLVRSEEREGTRVFELTDEGRATTEREDFGEGQPWEAGDEGDARLRLRDALAQAHVAARVLSHTGRPEQVERAVEVLERARRELYQVLAEG